MAKTRMLGGAVLAGALLCWLALPAAADGLSRFQAALKKAEQANPARGELTYKGGKALGANGFVLDDVLLAAKNGKTEPVAIKRLTVEEFDFDSVDKNQPPAFIKLRAEGIAVSGKPAAGLDLAKLVGIDKVTADVSLDYRFDARQKTLAVKQFNLDVAGLARVDFSMILDGVSPDQAGKPEAAMKDATLRSAALTFEDRSLLAKVLPAAAKAQGLDADTLVKTGTAMLVGMRAGQGPAAIAALDAAVSYMNDYKHPQGPLRITLDPPAKTSAATAMAAIKTPDDAVKALGLKVSYAGTKPQGAAEPASPAAAAAAAAAKVAVPQK